MICPRCNTNNQQNVNFCKQCGQKLKVLPAEAKYARPVMKASVFFFVMVAYIVVLYLIRFSDSYTNNLLVDIAFAAIVLLFAGINFRELKSQLFFRRMYIKPLLVVLLLMPLFALLIHYFAAYLNEAVFDKTKETYYSQYTDSPAPLFFSLLSIAVFPAVFEEIAFRGVLFADAVPALRLKPTIIFTAILFTIIHFSLISVLWILPSGLLFGYLRARYRTIWYGVIGHMLYNGSLVILEIVLP